MMLPLHALLLAITVGSVAHVPVRARHTQPAHHVLVAPVATPLREVEILDVLQRTAPRAPRRRVLMTWALVALETGRGRFVHSNNLGNTGAGKGSTAQRHGLRDGGVYESFATPTAGAVKLWRILTRCSSAMARFDAGDGMGAAHALRRCGYHRTNPAIYGASLRSLYHEALTRWPVQVRPVRRHRARPTLYARHEVTR